MRNLSPLPPATACTEQTCTVDSTITNYDANAVANGCTPGGTLNAVSDTTSCDLGCADGYIVVTETETLQCSANGNAATGTLTESLQCTGPCTGHSCVRVVCPGARVV